MLMFEYLFQSGLLRLILTYSAVIVIIVLSNSQNIMEPIKFEDSAKNIPIHGNKTYTELLIHSAEVV